MTTVRPLSASHCQRCGHTSTAPRSTCPNCSDWPNNYGYIRAAFIFDGVMRESIHEFKYTGQRARGEYLGDLLGNSVAEITDNAPTWTRLIGIPLHPRRYRERGFNQAEVLANALSDRFQIPMSYELRRVRDTPSQVGKRMAERYDNMLGAFGWAGESLTGESVLLIDDVVTTGATLLSAMSALAEAGADRIDGIALARQVFQRDD